MADIIEKIVSQNVGGIKTIEITTLLNSDFSDDSIIDSIPFRLYSANLDNSGGAKIGGYAVDKALTFEIPKNRDDVDELIAARANTSFAIRITDYNEDITILSPARISHGYSSGKVRTDSNNYEVRIEGVLVYSMDRPSPVVYVDTPPIVGDDDVPGDEIVAFNPPPPDEDDPNTEENEGDTGPGGNDDATDDIPECVYITISPTQTDNVIDANFYNLPDTYTLEVSLDGVVKATALPYTITESGQYKIKVIAIDCEKFATITAQYTDDAPFSVSITEADGLLTAVTDAATPTYLWEYEDSTGKTSTGTASTLILDKEGIYHLTVSNGPETQSTYYLYLVSDLNITVTNLDEISNASGSIQIIENTTGNVFDLDIDESRWIRFRNGVEMQYRQGVAASSLDVNEYDIVNGQLVISSLFPLTTDDIIENRPV